MLHVVLVLSLLFAFINGFHDGCNVFATAVASRSISPQKALLIAFVCEFIFPLAAGTAVASTIGNVLNQEMILGAQANYALLVFLSTLLGSMIWNVITWIVALPSSSSHALIGGLIGSGIIAFGVDVVKWPILINRILLILFVTPVIGFIAGGVMHRVSRLLLRNATCKADHVLKQLHCLSIVFLAGSHGIADAQKTMGIIGVLLVIGNGIGSFYIPFWVKLCSAGALAFGLLCGGWRILHTVGNKIYKLKTLHSFETQIAAASVIFISSALGGAVSTSQIISSAVTGVGAADRHNAVNWKTVENIISSWVLTIPAAAVISILVFLAAKQLIL